MTSTIVDFPKENSSLKETFFDIRKECKEFKEGLFNPNVELIENDIGTFDVGERKTYSKGKIDDEILKRIRLNSELMDYYKKKINSV